MRTLRSQPLLPTHNQAPATTPIVTHHGLAHCRTCPKKSSHHLHVTILAGHVQRGATSGLPSSRHTSTPHVDGPHHPSESHAISSTVCARLHAPSLHEHRSSKSREIKPPATNRRTPSAIPTVTHPGLVHRCPCPNQGSHHLHVTLQTGDYQRGGTIRLSSNTPGQTARYIASGTFYPSQEIKAHTHRRLGRATRPSLHSLRTYQGFVDRGPLGQ